MASVSAPVVGERDGDTATLLTWDYTVLPPLPVNRRRNSRAVANPYRGRAPPPASGGVTAMPVHRGGQGTAAACADGGGDHRGAAQ